MVRNFTSAVLLRTVASYISGNKPQNETSESPCLHIKQVPHLRKHQSYDSQSLSTSHVKNLSSISTAHDTPTKPHLFTESHSRDFSKITLPSLLPEASNVWNIVLSYLISQAATDGRRMTLLFLKNCAKKHDLDMVKTLFMRDMKNLPGTTKSEATKDSFLRLFDIKTRCRIESKLRTLSLFKSAESYCHSDAFVYEQECCLCAVPVESEEAYVEEPLEGNEVYEGTDSSQHERTGTTVYHAASASYTIVAQPFYPGPVVNGLVRLLGRFLTESLEDTKLVLVLSTQSLLASLCGLPSRDPKVQVLMVFLLDLEPEFPCQVQGMMTTVLGLERDILERIRQTTHFISLYRQFPCSPVLSPKHASRSISPLPTSQSAQKRKEFELEDRGLSADEVFTEVVAR